MSSACRVWIQGAGEMASGVAIALLKAGHQVILAEIPNPLAVRRLVCFSEAVYETHAVVDGWHGHLVALNKAEYTPGQATVVIDPEATGLQELDPSIVVDARMTKKAPHLLPVAKRPVIGLGPGFTCGENANCVIETMRGPTLGQVIRSGTAAAYTGCPGPVGGETLSRLLRAPAAGHLVPVCRIGDIVKCGQVVGHVAGLPVRTGLGGCLRGLVHERAELISGEKVGDVDPRGGDVDPAALTDKAQKVGAGVLAAVNELEMERI